MKHVGLLRNCSSIDSNPLINKASGRYYTGEPVGRRLARVVAQNFRLHNPNAQSITVIDPFGGDGRLVHWLISEWRDLGYPPVHWEVSIWDINGDSFEVARTCLFFKRHGDRQPDLSLKVLDTFREVEKHQHNFDIVLTNPPWELLKPDSRELDLLPSEMRDAYVAEMRAYDKWLASHYPLSQPKKKFAGWGTNLSRVGLEASLRLSKPKGLVGIVLPASIFADDQSVVLRKHLLCDNNLLDVGYYPAEAKLYGKADVESATAVIRVQDVPSSSVALFTYGVNGAEEGSSPLQLRKESLEKIDFVLPVAFGAKATEVLGRLAELFPRWVELEERSTTGLWAGREVDETRISPLIQHGNQDHDYPLFIKGRMIGRYQIVEPPKQQVALSSKGLPSSLHYNRIVWRDISRPSQKRRMIATLIPSGWVAGNSLGVAHLRDSDPVALLALLGVMNSTVFEFQLRAHLATGHVSLSSIRKVAIPPLEHLREEVELSQLVQQAEAGDTGMEAAIDAYVAKKLYKLTKEDYCTILSSFTKLTATEVASFVKAFLSISSCGPSITTMTLAAH